MELTESMRLFHKAEKLIPLQTQTFSKGPKYFPFGVSPIYIRSAKGSTIIDVDGNKFIDFICALGPITLGWQYPAVDNAIRAQLEKGIIFSLPSELEVELAELLCTYVPSAQMARFMKTGTEACMAAIRVARAHTGREILLASSYHGWSDVWAISSERPGGVPEYLRPTIEAFQYNNLVQVTDLVKKYGTKLAAII